MLALVALATGALNLVPIMTQPVRSQGYDTSQHSAKSTYAKT